MTIYIFVFEYENEYSYFQSTKMDGTLEYMCNGKRTFK